MPELRDLNMWIIAQIKDINQDAGQFVADILSDDISRNDQISFAHRLVDLADAIRDRARQTPGMVIEGSTIDDGDDHALSSGPADHPDPTLRG